MNKLKYVLQYTVLTFTVITMLFLGCIIIEGNMSYNNTKDNEIENIIKPTVIPTFKEATPKPVVVINYYQYAKEMSIHYNVPFALVEGIVWNESRWSINAVNHNTNGSYDIGLFQLNTYAITDILNLIQEPTLDMYKPEDNIKIGVKYLAYWYNYWHKVGYTGTNLHSMVMSSYSVPSMTLAGIVNWEYIGRVRTKVGWEF
jgi:hypothetical protein